ncbi:GntR family transcriptional regulator [Peptoniphilus equinus]|uniref:GntR family transcriptional regulator n=1 Tax=Peptoniphilus equinus TaxID=3016343 RepID=A0ABY7QWM8_9FIRM|nr:GntR family transcriptional regulator [Peptoniphilus equinus]WBW50308.1 GntR family transcriptional regulator [Peptoniphilus equinus]
MNIIIKKSSPLPIYEQIEQEIKGLIASGELSSHDPLPGMRSLAKDLGVSVITTKRAFNDLEQEGFIYTLAGRGSFVSETSREEQKGRIRSEARQLLRTCVEFALQHQLTQADLEELLEEVYYECTPGESRQ